MMIEFALVTMLSNQQINQTFDKTFFEDLRKLELSLIMNAQPPQQWFSTLNAQMSPEMISKKAPATVRGEAKKVFSKLASIRPSLCAVPVDTSRGVPDGFGASAGIDAKKLQQLLPKAPESQKVKVILEFTIGYRGTFCVQQVSSLGSKTQGSQGMTDSPRAGADNRSNKSRVSEVARAPLLFKDYRAPASLPSGVSAHLHRWIYTHYGPNAAQHAEKIIFSLRASGGSVEKMMQDVSKILMQKRMSLGPSRKDLLALFPQETHSDVKELLRITGY